MPEEAVSSICLPDQPARYPWQQQQWQSLMLAHQQQRLPHALLLTGPQGIGKQSFALLLAKTLLCQSPVTENDAPAPCGHCNACQLFDAATHPDLHWLAPEEAGKPIKVDQVREMIEKNALTASVSSIKVHLVFQAQAMNISAANSLLKTLEEPSPNSFILLITANPELLPATIRSRCQSLVMPLPSAEQAHAWLASQQVKADADLLLSLAQGAPLSALALDRDDQVSLRDEVFQAFGRVVFGKADPVKVAEQWQGLDHAQLLNWLTIWVIDMIRLKLSTSAPFINSADKLNGLEKIASVFAADQLYARYREQLQARRLLDRQLNRQLLLESLLIPWVAPANSTGRQRPLS